MSFCEFLRREIKILMNSSELIYSSIPRDEYRGIFQAFAGQVRSRRYSPRVGGFNKFLKFPIARLCFRVKYRGYCCQTYAQSLAEGRSEFDLAFFSFSTKAFCCCCCIAVERRFSRKKLLICYRISLTWKSISHWFYMRKNKEKFYQIVGPESLAARGFIEHSGLKVDVPK